MLKTFSFLMVMLAVASMDHAQSSTASFDAARKVFRLDGGNTTYAFGVNGHG